MPESIFQQVSLDILRLQQHTARSLLAVPHDEAAEIPVCGHRLQTSGEETPWRRVN